MVLGHFPELRINRYSGEVLDRLQTGIKLQPGKPLNFETLLDVLLEEDPAAGAHFAEEEVEEHRVLVGVRRLPLDQPRVLRRLGGAARRARRRWWRHRLAARSSRGEGDEQRRESDPGQELLLRDESGSDSFAPVVEHLDQKAKNDHTQHAEHR